MEPRPDKDLPKDLEAVADRLRAARATADPLALDGLKRRVMARADSAHRTGPALRSRIATVLTILGLIGGAGGALAIADSGSGHPAVGAAAGQYTPPKKCKHPPCKHHAGVGGKGTTTTPTAPTEESQAGEQETAERAEQALPFTGEDVLEVLGVGLLLLGGGIVVSRRVRRT
jgi:hypothetical protein